MKHVYMENAIDADVVSETFTTKIVSGRDRANSKMAGGDRVVVDQGYIEVLQPIFASMNPSCRFTVPVTECFVKRNKQKENEKIKLFSIKFKCAFENCPMRAVVHVSNPDGHVNLFFSKTRLWDGPAKEEKGMYPAINFFLGIGKVWFGERGQNHRDV